MRRILASFACAALFSGIALAEEWTGKLVDASCYDRQNPSQQGTPAQPKAQTPAPQANAPQSQGASSCMPSSTTTAFAVIVDGKAFKLDATGNSQAMAALRSRAEREAPGKQGATSDINAKVDGTETGGTIRVTKIELQ